MHRERRGAAGAARLARGSLQALDVCAGLQPLFTFETLLEVLTGNAGALRELRVRNFGPNIAGSVVLTFDRVQTLLQSAPRLRSLDAQGSLHCQAQQAHALLAEPDFAAVRVRYLCATFNDGAGPTVAEQTTSLMALATGVAAHTALVELILNSAPHDTPAAFNAVIDASLSRGVRSPIIECCHLTPACAPALVRLLVGSSALRTLDISNEAGVFRPLLDAPAAALLCGALRANRTLSQLWLNNVALWDDPTVGVALLAALTAHPSLPFVALHSNPVRLEDAATAGAAFAALVAANSPALHKVLLDGSALGEAGLRLLLDALQSNTHLFAISFDVGGVAEDQLQPFARNVLLPALVQARARSLHVLVRDDDGDEVDVEGLARLNEPTMV